MGSNRHIAAQFRQEFHSTERTEYATEGRKEVSTADVGNATAGRVAAGTYDFAI
jgi:hypothetical protein